MSIVRSWDGRSGYGGKRKRHPILRGLAWVFVFGLVCAGLLEGAILAAGRDLIRGEPQVMIVLGCQVKPWGPSTLLRDRLDKALAYLKDHPDMTVVATGGRGPDEPVSEARCIYAYLTEHGVDGDVIFLEENSHNTYQNLRNSLALLAGEGYGTARGVVVVSNAFHLARVRLLWGRIAGGTENLSTLAAPSTHPPSTLKMYLREPLALVKSFVWDR